MEPIRSTRFITIRSTYTIPAGQEVQNYNWKESVRLSVEAFEGFTGWTGDLSGSYRTWWPHDGDQEDLSRFDQLIPLLQQVPREQIYPPFSTPDLTRFDPTPGGEKIFLKAPRLIHCRDDEVARRLLGEAKIWEMILRNPHRNLSSYLGCVVDKGQIVRLAFKAYNKSLSHYYRESTEVFSTQQRIDCMNQVEAAATHLHSLGYAHNDISPRNIMFDDDGHAILIDMDCCAPLGSPIQKGGLTTGWKGPMTEGQKFSTSSAECDKLAIQGIRDCLF
ncbi:kinase-like domain-containing protein [Plectosphaerella cucumerina]|uniref:Kinase-like domain-containing protein n=1 Tax=Plectosphaerella cucumerina TaxID=40658 RepID=A0A8K0X6A5_9PEZI|nr:kinase-like domain-containing protein [Plectosphaerella cucumerina]